MMRASFVTQTTPPAMPTGIGLETLGIAKKASEEDVALIKKVLDRIDREGVENVVIDKSESKAIWNVLYGRHNTDLPSISFRKFWGDQNSEASPGKRSEWLKALRGFLQSDLSKKTTETIVLVLCAVVYVTMVVGTLVSRISPFTRVGMLTATSCG